MLHPSHEGQYTADQALHPCKLRRYCLHSCLLGVLHMLLYWCILESIPPNDPWMCLWWFDVADSGTMSSWISAHSKLFVNDYSRPLVRTIENLPKKMNILQHPEWYQNPSTEFSLEISGQALQYIHVNTDIWIFCHQGPFCILDIYKGRCEE